VARSLIRDGSHANVLGPNPHVDFGHERLCLSLDQVSRLMPE
jgi:hypothetical protein